MCELPVDRYLDGGGADPTSTLMDGRRCLLYMFITFAASVVLFTPIVSLSLSSTSDM